MSVSDISFRAASCCPTRLPWEESASLNLSKSAGSMCGQIILLGLSEGSDPKADTEWVVVRYMNRVYLAGEVGRSSRVLAGLWILATVEDEEPSDEAHESSV